MLTKFKDYDTISTINKNTKLQPGGYVCKILNAYIEPFQYNDGNAGENLIIEYDICEGDYKDYFTKQYDRSTFENKKYKGIYRLSIPIDDETENDSKRKRIFKTFINNIECSNKPYVWNWDEHTLKSKVFGGVFGEKEYDYNGYQGTCIILRYTETVENIRDNKYYIPPKIELKKEPKAELIEMTDNAELPF